jgi:hypothetical protein
LENDWCDCHGKGLEHDEKYLCAGSRWGCCAHLNDVGENWCPKFLQTGVSCMDRYIELPARAPSREKPKCIMNEFTGVRYMPSDYDKTLYRVVKLGKWFKLTAKITSDLSPVFGGV